MSSTFGHFPLLAWNRNTMPEGATSICENEESYTASMAEQKSRRSCCSSCRTPCNGLFWREKKKPGTCFSHCSEVLQHVTRHNLVDIKVGRVLRKRRMGWGLWTERLGQSISERSRWEEGRSRRRPSPRLR